ncbi:unnamed protein product, partial [marine sediment metagenome]
GLNSPFQENIPDRFIQVGVAEQNMIGVAAGLATTGLKPFASTLAVFCSRRACDQVTTSVALQNLNVKILGVYPGIFVGKNGASHQSLEDIAIMRAIARMTVIQPADAYGHLLEIVKTDKLNVFNSLDEWLIHRYENQNRVVNDNYGEKVYKKQSLTKNAIQVNWAVPSEFPCCPQGIVDNPITAYFENLKKGSFFCINNSYQRMVSDAALSEDKKTVFVASESTDVENAVKPWALAKITYKNSVYVHYSLGSYFEKNGVE